MPTSTWNQTNTEQTEPTESTNQSRQSLSVLSFQFMKPAKGKENTQSLKIWFMRPWTIFQGYIKKWSNKGTDPVAERRFRKTSKKWPDVSPANAKYDHK